MVRFHSNYSEGMLRKAQINRLNNLSSLYAREVPKISSQVYETSSWIKTFEGLRFTENSLASIAITIFFALSSYFILQSLLPSLLIVGVFFIFVKYKQQEVRRVQKAFMAEYPAVMLATASNLKAGLSVYGALERATHLLDNESIVKKEVLDLLEKISRGISKEKAVSEFATRILLPEIRLFRRAFLLVLVHGGKFSRTLERLSEVCRDRDSLIKSSQVSTASMRMTANVLLLMAPVLLFMLSFRTKDFWGILLHHPTASKIAGVGLMIILGAFYILRRLSDFKP